LAQGDFNFDGFVDGQDFIIWNSYKFTSVGDDVFGVPEPCAGLFFLTACAVVLGRSLRQTVSVSR